MNPKTRKPATAKTRFAYEDPEYGTAQQRLADAIAMGGKTDVNRLLTVMNYMGGNQATPLEAETAQNYAPSIYDRSAPVPNMDMRPTGVGRVFQESPGSMIRVQAPSEDVRYDYINEGGPLRAQQIGALTGYEGSVSSRDKKLLDDLLSNPDFVRYFTDIYGSADKSYRPLPRARGREPMDWRRGVDTESQRGPKGTPTGGYTALQVLQKNCAMDPSCKRMHGVGLPGLMQKLGIGGGE